MYNLETIKNRTFDYDDFIEEFVARWVALKNEFGSEYVVDMFEDKILDLKDIYVSRFFCNHVKGTNITAHGKIIIDSKNPYVNYHFAHEHVKTADIESHRKVVLDSKNLFLNLRFIIDIIMVLNPNDTEKINEHKQILIDAKEDGMKYLKELEDFVDKREKNINVAYDKAIKMNEYIDGINELIKIKKYKLPRQKIDK